VSIFNEDTSLGKKYMFDIRRTCREVYDNARRALYQNSGNGGGFQISPLPSVINSAQFSAGGKSHHGGGGDVTSSDCLVEQCKVCFRSLKCNCYILTDSMEQNPS